MGSYPIETGEALLKPLEGSVGATEPRLRLCMLLHVRGFLRVAFCAWLSHSCAWLSAISLALSPVCAPVPSAAMSRSEGGRDNVMTTSSS